MSRLRVRTTSATMTLAVACALFVVVIAGCASSQDSPRFVYRTLPSLVESPPAPDEVLRVGGYMGADPELSPEGAEFTISESPTSSVAILVHYRGETPEGFGTAVTDGTPRVIVEGTYDGTAFDATSLIMESRGTYGSP